nr:MAG TPA: hypothetical protein [Caudoviricetes sp.]
MLESLIFMFSLIGRIIFKLKNNFYADVNVCYIISLRKSC